MKEIVYIDSFESIIYGKIDFNGDNYLSDEECNRMYNCDYETRIRIGVVQDSKIQIDQPFKWLLIHNGKVLQVSAAFIDVDASKVDAIYLWNIETSHYTQFWKR